MEIQSGMKACVSISYYFMAISRTQRGLVSIRNAELPILETMISTRYLSRFLSVADNVKEENFEHNAVRC
jgi:hypothetical protein